MVFSSLNYQARPVVFSYIMTIFYYSFPIRVYCFETNSRLERGALRAAHIISAKRTQQMSNKKNII